MENRTKYGPEEYAEELVNMEEWDEGASAAHTGFRREENPYPKAPKKWDAWNAGYDAEQSVYDEHFGSKHPKRQPSEHWISARSRDATEDEDANLILSINRVEHSVGLSDAMRLLDEIQAVLCLPRHNADGLGRRTLDADSK